MKKIWPVLVTAALAAAIWVLSEPLTGQAEPWDAFGSYYLAALFITGLLGGLLFAAPYWTYYVGAYLGQAAYLAFAFLSRPDGLILIGLAFLLGYCVVAVLGAMLGSWAHQRIMAVRQKT
ncbi:MAG: hypothetical protein Q4G39_08380 [Brachymonas sp.]|nr:hypothetical protein [Brachymonas sp.]